MESWVFTWREPVCARNVIFQMHDKTGSRLTIAGHSVAITVGDLYQSDYSAAALKQENQIFWSACNLSGAHANLWYASPQDI
jgi:hypothetical protein